MPSFSPRPSTHQPTSPDPNLEDWRPKSIGAYTILRVLGEGGMGTVYLAEQLVPLRRQVALKVIKLGLDNKETLARFDQERQALSLMGHANIAAVLDGGATEDGRPFFVMEYVDGIRITDYCDNHRLTVQARLEIFLDICNGLQHAHQKGIIHRDIKPSNILVADQDGKPVPKLIDFGLALATDEQLTDQTLLTRQGQWIGTPEYMSPEQAGSGVDVDTRADVYSLGVLLYELLTGHRPFDSWLLREQGLAEIQRTIQEEEPPKPSSKVSTIADGGNEHAERRRTDPLGLHKRLRGDLDWIVMRALEKERSRRYGSSTELAADIRRHLQFEPVLASPPSWVYRTRKFLRRYRIQVSATAIATASLIIGLVIAFSQYRTVKAQTTVLGQQKTTLQDQKHDLEVKQKALLESERAATKSAAEAQRANTELASTNNQLVTEAAGSNRMLGMLRYLSFVPRLAEAKLEAAKLFPAWPTNEAAMREWIIKYTPLPSEANQLRSAIRRISNDIEEHLVDGKLPQRGTSGLLAFTAMEWSTLALDLQDARKPHRRETLLMANLWINSFLLGSLRGLATDLEAFRRNELRDMRQRLSWSRRIKREFIGKYKAKWDTAITEIAASPVYGGLRIVPQYGLVPLGMNPNTKLQEFFHLRSREFHQRRTNEGPRLPRRDRSGRLRTNVENGIVFVLIPAGKFHLGAQPSDPAAIGYDAAAQLNEAPVRRITLEPFFVAKYEMTQAQWKQLTGQEPSVFQPGRDPGGRFASSLRAVENVSYLECMEVLRHQGFELPTEAQWEYAARCAKTKTEATGNLSGTSDGWSKTALVGRFVPNGFGLFDTCGNVAEWCRDGLGTYSKAFRAGDGLRGSAKESAMVRGGSWSSTAPEARATHRRSFLCDKSSDQIGVRPVRKIYD
ncbi:MAG: hypothetical protein CMJ85_11115 [Planctomycetes bacterium]|nr:hypothetical protein [Planctomycetota bacterium]